MQYEVVILEMLTRIKKLEEEVELLKIRCAEMQVTEQENESDDGNTVVEESCSTSHQAVTDEMIEMCYEYGKKLFNGGKIRMLVNEISSKTGMNRNSAIMALYAVSNMLAGTVYKRAINQKANRRYFDRIYNEYGTEGLKKAIHAAPRCVSP